MSLSVHNPSTLAQRGDNLGLEKEQLESKRLGYQQGTRVGSKQKRDRNNAICAKIVERCILSLRIRMLNLPQGQWPFEECEKKCSCLWCWCNSKEGELANPEKRKEWVAFNNMRKKQKRDARRTLSAEDMARRRCAYFQRRYEDGGIVNPWKNHVETFNSRAYRLISATTKDFIREERAKSKEQRAKNKEQMIEAIQMRCYQAADIL